jgi:3-oxoacyl-[acyl-carrier-protein] synthase III
MNEASGVTHLSGTAYELPARSYSLEELAAQGLLTSEANTLRGLGFELAHIAGDAEDAYAMAHCAAERAIAAAGLAPEQIGYVLHASALASSGYLGNTGSGGASLDDYFRYPAGRLQYELGLSRATVLGVSQQGCAGLFGAITLARALIGADPRLEHVLCVSSDTLPPGSTREVLYNVISDGACAVLVTRGEGPNRILGQHQVTKGYYWDGAALRNELLAAYFPTSRLVIQDALRQQGGSADDLDWIVPHNVGRRSWEILLGTLGIPIEKLYDANIGRRGHTIASDNFMNLEDMAAEGRLAPGDRLLLFTFGFGAHWSTLLLEH